MLKTIGLIGVPSSMGAFAPGQERAPRALREAGLVQRLTQAGVEVVDYGDSALRRWFPDSSHRAAQHASAVAEIAAETAEARRSRDWRRADANCAGRGLYGRARNSCRVPPE
jgi:arginase